MTFLKSCVQEYKVFISVKHSTSLAKIEGNKTKQEWRRTSCLPCYCSTFYHFIVVVFFHALVYLIENYTKLRWWSSWCAPNNMWKHSENKFVCFCFNAECSFVVPIYFTTHRKDLWKNINRSVLLHRTSLIKECNDTLK